MLAVVWWNINNRGVGAFEIGSLESLDRFLNIPGDAHVNVSLLLVVVQSDANIFLLDRKIRGNCVNFAECTEQMFYSTTLFELDKKIVNYQGEGNSVSAVHEQTRSVNTLYVLVDLGKVFQLVADCRYCY